MGFQIADRWFEFRRVNDDITLIRESHVVPLIRCNIWHVRGRDRDLLIDTGLGTASLRAAARHLFEKRLTAVATHAHYDHIGGLHEFKDRTIHRAEAGKAEAGGSASLYAAGNDDGLLESIRAAGHDVPPELPQDGYDPRAYRVLPAAATRTLEEGDVVDFGNRQLEILHLPATRRVALDYGKPRPVLSSPAMRSATAPCWTSCRVRTSRSMSRS